MDISVRMYRNGLGDCFVLTFADGVRVSHMMIDCGVLTGTAHGAEKINSAVENILAHTGGRIEILVVTHEHWDHVSGFVQAGDKLQGVPIEEIWLAWTEDDTDGIARQLRQNRAKTRTALQAAGQKLQSVNSIAARQTHKLLTDLAAFDGELGVAGRRTTAEAMKWIREHETASIRCLKPGGKVVTSPAIPGIRVYILGPPQNVKQLRKSRPSKSSPEVYQLADGPNAGFVDALSLPSDDGSLNGPFDPSFDIPTQKATGMPFFDRNYFSTDSWRQISDDWLGSSESLALQLDSDTNNTSLVLAIEDIATGRMMLFPGDAQVGNWLSWHDHAWSYRRPNGQEERRTLQEILASTVLYKVAHHGSHNATLDERGLELMSHPDLVALIPVDGDKARELRWEMPFDPLLRRLLEKTRGRVIRSDIGVPSKPDTTPERTWRDFQARIRTEELFIEYRLP
jgi:hypothetical protein